MPSHLSARYVFRAGGLPDDLLGVVDFAGDEAISQPFRYVVNLVSTDPDIAFEDVVNEKASLLMARGDEVSPVHGIVTDFQQGRRVSITLGDRYLYRAVLVPRLQRLAYSHQSRIFQNLTVQEIVTKVLAESDLSGADVRFKLQGSYSPREYCTQYKETDLQFVQRLLEYEGIRYHFEHGESSETLVITDDAQAAPAIEGDDTLFYHIGGGLAAAETAETVREFVTHQKVVTGRVVLKDYNYRTPGSPIQTESQLNGDMPGVFYDYGIHVKDASEGARLAKVRNEEIECQREQMVGASDCLRFRAGATFALKEHYRDGMNQSYLLTHLHHEGRQPDASPFITGDADIPEYTNGFTCIPASAPYRPPRLTPEPKIPGVMTAMVESGGGDYAYLDDQGRYRLKMPFDLSDATDGSASKAIRLAQPYTGPDYGQHFPVHKGAEMVFACVDGHVDRPLGLATVPNPSQASPVTSANAPQNVVRTWGRNEFTLDDTKGSENIYMHATKDHTVEVTNDEEIQIGNNRSKRVGTDERLVVGRHQTESVGKDQTLEVGDNQSISVGINRSMSVGANLDETVGAAMSVTVGASLSQSIGSSMDETVALAKTETIGAAYMLSVGAVKTETVGGASSESVGAVKTLDVGASLSQTIGTDLTITAGKDGTLTVGKDYTVKVGDKTSLESGKDVTVQSGKKVVIQAADEMTLKCGSSKIVMKKNGDITIQGKKINVKGSGDLILKGSKITAN
jgi:type VI secretion system secreted protein VgrG